MKIIYMILSLTHSKYGSPHIQQNSNSVFRLFGKHLVGSSFYNYLVWPDTY